MTDPERKAFVEEVRLAVARDVCLRLSAFLGLVIWVVVVAGVLLYLMLRLG